MEKAKKQEEMKNVDKIAKAKTQKLAKLEQAKKQEQQKPGIETKIELAKLEEAKKREEMENIDQIAKAKTQELTKLEEAKKKKNQELAKSKQELAKLEETKKQEKQELDIKTKIKLANYQKAKNKLQQHIQDMKEQFVDIKKKLEGSQHS